MSPLARALLAFGALLAAADATVTYPNLLGGMCRGFTMEIPPKITHVSSTYNFKLENTDGHNELLKDIPNYCTSYGKGNIAKQTVDVCNRYSGPIKYISPPNEVYALGDAVLSPVYASCGNDPGCGPLSWNITQVCRF